MFKKATLKLALIYSLLFFSLFWIFSVGVYVWMQQNSSVEYIVKKVDQAEQQGEHTGASKDKTTTTILSIANKAALEQLKTILLELNAVLLFIIPSLSWFLARRTLVPVERAYERESKFVSDASHELRTPLTILGGEMEVALNKSRSNEEYVKTLRSAKEEIDRLAALAENLLFLSRYDMQDSKKYMAVFEEVDLTDAAAKAVVILKPKADQKHISLNLNFGEESIVVKGNAAMLLQVLFNVIHNAINYTRQGGNINVALEKVRAEAVIRVSDTGIGVAKDEQNKIFDRFYRVDLSRSAVKGYGLGLSICRIIMHLHGGIISVQSALGKGSVFTVRLPLSTREGKPRL
ncbi:MAG: ATP-binding protein [Patescibacteria group bacterium]|nr:ATP-binding protein [Patescibacteria group bacterium]